MYSKSTTLLLSLTLAAATACGKKSSSDKTDPTAPGAGGNNPAQEGKAGVIAAKSLADLKLSQAFAISLPNSVTGDAQASLELAGRKSAEACEIGETARQSVDAILQMGELFCHFEVEKDTIVFGKKYKIKFPAGAGLAGDQEEELSLWIDNSQQSEGILRIYQCQGGNKDKIEITGVADGKAKGTIARAGSHEGSSFADMVTFDAGFTDAKRSFVANKSQWKGAGGESFGQVVSIESVKDGISKILMSRKGTWQGSQFAQAGAVKDNGTYAAALFRNTFKGNGYDMSDVSRAYFDQAGTAIAADTSPILKEGGALFVASADLPKFIEGEITVVPFTADEWDCGGEATNINPRSPAHEECGRKAGREHQNRDCHATDFENGTREDHYDENAAKPVDQVVGQ